MSSAVLSRFTPVVLLALALGIGLYDVGNSGSLWPDSPRYENAGAMMRDWVVGGFRGSPMQHATDNYARYPAFSVPYHPPGYPSALAGWFLVFGQSYLAARVFVALCWGVCGWLFQRLLRDFSVTPLVSFGAALVLLTTPQLAMWARDPMSEIPSFVPLFGAAICWNRWLMGRGRWYGFAAFALAEVAFFFRVTTAGVVPGLLLYGLLSGQLPRRRWLGVAIFGGLYLAINAVWVKFAAKYATQEVTADGKGQLTTQHIVDYFYNCAGDIFLSGTVALAIVVSARHICIEGKRLLLFWFSWLGSFLLFKIVVVTSFEPRHFATALPAFAGFTALLGLRRMPLINVIIPFVLTVIANGLILAALYKPGLVGYEAVAKTVAASDKPGNVLLACWEDQDWIFRYRCEPATRTRYCLRSDRTLAIRVSDYANKEAEVLGTTPEDVLAVMRDGRVGTVITCEPSGNLPEVKWRTDEMKLVHETMRSHPQLVRLVGEFPVVVDYFNWGHSFGGTVYVWQVIADVDEGKPNIKVVVPTAGMDWKP